MDLYVDEFIYMMMDFDFFWIMSIKKVLYLYGVLFIYFLSFLIIFIFVILWLCILYKLFFLSSMVMGLLFIGKDLLL